LDNIIIIFILLAIVALLSYLSVNRKYLSLSGALVANLLGVVLIFTAGILYFLSLLFAFIIANLATSYRIEEKINLKLIIAKKPIRDWRNVLGNGLPILFFALLEYYYSSDIFLIGFLASTATFLSDTVSTEIGVLSKTKPVMITNFEKVHAGRSGAISLRGLLAGLFCSFIFSIFSFFLIGFHNFVALILIILISSTIGNLFDSLLGATIQGNYFCEKCNMYSEERIHTCGFLCKHVSGLTFFNNHIVNFISILFGGLISILFVLVIP